MEQLKSIDEVVQWIEKSNQQPVFFYKHSFQCPISAGAFEEIKTFEKKHPNTPIVWIDVIDSRDVSNHLAELSSITHHSPQIILYHQGNPVWNTSHREITLTSLEQNIT